MGAPSFTREAFREVIDLAWWFAEQWLVLALRLKTSSHASKFEWMQRISRLDQLEREANEA